MQLYSASRVLARKDGMDFDLPPTGAWLILVDFFSGKEASTAWAHRSMKASNSLQAGTELSRLVDAGLQCHGGYAAPCPFHL